MRAWNIQAISLHLQFYINQSAKNKIDFRDLHLVDDCLINSMENYYLIFIIIHRKLKSILTKSNASVKNIVSFILICLEKSVH